MAKNITFDYQGKTYTLEFNRRTVEKLEASGFNADTASTMPVTSIRKLFEGAFLMHHPYVKRELISEIFNEFTNKEDLFDALIDLYTEPINAMSEDSKSKNAIQWEKNF